ncbi:MAG: LacI family transcriptional regulator [Cellulomonadaceae bacterium]|nr:LacI family transcriptional regulator [Cellulomonadaceae bacterium]
MVTDAPAPLPAQARLRDVAQAAGVSLATASKALNGKNEVNASTRQRVQEAADRLGFVPNTLVQAMLQGRSGTVGLITNDLDGRFAMPILMGAEDAFGAGKMSVFLCDAREDAIREQYHLTALLGRRVDGIIVVGSNTDQRPPLAARIPIPVVYAYAPSTDPGDAAVIVDERRGGAMAVEHLIATGRRRIAHISGDVSYTAARDRAAGALAACEDAGLTMVGPVRYGTWTEAWGRAATPAVLADRADAILCGSDQIARGVLDALRDASVSVPDQVAVASFDNWEPMIAGTRPSLTSMDMQLGLIGKRAAERLFEILSGTETHSGIEKLIPRLVVRGSTVAGA